MKNLCKTIGVFIGGCLAGVVLTQIDVDRGDVVHNDDEKYIKAAKSKAGGWSYAKVVWKDPEK